MINRLAHRRGKSVILAYVVLACVVLAACVPPARRLPAVLPEVSGMVFDSDGRLLAVNDGGHEAVVYAIDLRERTARVAYTYAVNVDTEALTAAANGSGLIVCDVGDNRRARAAVTVTPLGAEGGRAAAFDYPDGPRDCEACLLRGDTLTLITKAQTVGGGRTRRAYVYRARLAADASPVRTLALVDSFALRRRSVTDATYLRADTVAVLAYDFRFFGPLPLSRTSVFVGTWADLRDGRAREIEVRAPFTLTQYEAIAAPRDGQRRLLIASERTPVSPQRYRWVRY